MQNVAVLKFDFLIETVVHRLKYIINFVKQFVWIMHNVCTYNMLRVHLFYHFDVLESLIGKLI